MTGDSDRRGRELRALVEEMRWKPIDSAPEATYVLLWLPNYGAVRGIGSRDYPTTPVLWWAPQMDGRHGAIVHPTHWRKEPLSPQQEAATLAVVAGDPDARHQEHSIDGQALAAAMRKLLPPHLLTEVVGYLDPLTPFVAALKGQAGDPDARETE